MDSAYKWGGWPRPGGGTGHHWDGREGGEDENRCGRGGRFGGKMNYFFSGWFCFVSKTSGEDSEVGIRRGRVSCPPGW